MWSMPRQVLQVVAVLLGLCAVGGFALGVGSAPNRSASARGDGPAGAPVVAPEATPLNTDAPPPPDPEEDEAAKAEEEAKKKAEAEAAAKLAAAQAALPKPAPSVPEPPPLAVPPPDPVGELLQTAPPPEEPPH